MTNVSTTIRIHELVALLNRYRDEYYNQNAPSVSDGVYDRLFDELVMLEKESCCILSGSPTQTVGYPVLDSLAKVRHPSRCSHWLRQSRSRIFSASWLDSR